MSNFNTNATFSVSVWNINVGTVVSTNTVVTTLGTTQNTISVSSKNIVNTTILTSIIPQDSPRPTSGILYPR